MGILDKIKNELELLFSDKKLEEANKIGQKQIDKELENEKGSP